MFRYFLIILILLVGPIFFVWWFYSLRHLTPEQVIRWREKGRLRLIIRALKAQDFKTRAVAARALTTKPDKRATRNLLGLLSDDEPDVRAAAISALAAIKGGFSKEKLIPGLSDPYYKVRFAAHDALLHLGYTPVDEKALAKFLAADILNPRSISDLEEMGPFSVEPVVNVFYDKGSEASRVQAAAVGILRNVRGETAVTPLLKLLTDRSATIRGAAAEALGYIGNHRSIEPLGQMLKTEKNEELLETVAIALARHHFKLALLRLLANSPTGRGDSVKAPPWLAHALEEIKDDSAYAFDPLVNYVENEKALYKAEALRVLGRLGDIRATPSILMCLKHPGKHVRAASVNALERLQDPQSIPAIAELLKEEKDEDIRISAVRALGKIKDRQSARELVMLYPEMSPPVGNAIRSAIKKFDVPEAANSLIRALIFAVRKRDTDMFEAAVEVLQKLKAPRTIDVLAVSAKLPEWPWRAASVKALGHFDTPRSLKIIYDALMEDESVWVRQAAAEALGIRGDPQAEGILKKALDDQDPKVTETVRRLLDEMKK